jgi:hypothetical protein
MKKTFEDLNKFQMLLSIIGNIYLIKVTKNIYSRIMILICILFIPRLTYLFSFNKKFPSYKDKIKKTKDPLDDFVLKSSKNFKNYKKKLITEEVLVFFKKECNDFKKYQYNDVKKFLVNWEDINTKGKNIFFATASNAGVSIYASRKQLPCFYVDQFYLDKNRKCFYLESIKKIIAVRFLSGIIHKFKLDPDHIGALNKDKKSKIFFINHKINYNNSETRPNLGSGITVIIALLKIYKKVLAFNFNLYQDKKVNNKSFFNATLSLVNHFKLIKQNNHAENIIYQCLYASRLLESGRLKIKGNLSLLIKQKKLIKNLETIIYQ